MPREQADLLEAVLVDQAATRSRAVSLPDCMLLVDPLLAASQLKLSAPGVQIGNLVQHCLRLCAFFQPEHSFSSTESRCRPVGSGPETSAILSLK